MQKRNKTSVQQTDKKTEAVSLEKHITKLTAIIADCEKKFEEKQTAYLRALADYQNLSRRLEDERMKIQKTITLSTAHDLIDLSHDIEKAQQFEKSTTLDLIAQKVYSALSRLGLAEINPLGAPFSPETMECVSVEEGKKDNIVTAVHSKGYMLGQELLKPARVSVSKINH